MKKFLSTTLALILALTMLCAGATAEAADMTGEWYASLYGVAMTLTLNGDGSYTIAMEMEGEEPSDGVWELDGTDLILDKGTEDEMAFSYDPDAQSLYADMDGMEFLFTREPIASFEPAAARADATLEEFAGSWSCTLVSLMGMQVPPEEAEIEMAMVIDGESVELTLGVFGEPVTASLTAAFADGAMTLTVPSSYEGGEDTVFTVQLLEDGTLQATTMMFDEELALFLEAV